ncbi:MAG: hypothetical protein JW806_04770 [Sedimentisphaerales bacterium]|nr:hypothetical protein [Sedimentisphaerales bacterium]
MTSLRKGVTLAELIVVVLILGAMSFVIVPRMSISFITTGKTRTTAHKITSAIRYARSLAIADAATNSQGYMVSMTGGGSYTGYEVAVLGSGEIVETGTIDPEVSCTGADDFRFGPLGQRTGDTDSLTVSGGGETYLVSVVTATGLVKCEEQ